ncbi:MAG: YaeQ family protein [Desulfovibrionales bacterium]|nr:YaeQ family protein [Desulfovibrionales bacterium]
MALKPTIYKFNVDLSHVDENYYDSLNLTVAQHPSENTERMMARVLAFCLNARKDLSFTKGLCVVEEPDIWARTLDGRIDLWIDVGEPGFDRLKKAARTANAVRVYSFNFKSPGWWKKEGEKLSKLAVEFFQFPWADIQDLAASINRTTSLSITISDNVIYVSLGEKEFSLEIGALNGR